MTDLLGLAVVLFVVALFVAPFVVYWRERRRPSGPWPRPIEAAAARHEAEEAMRAAPHVSDARRAGFALTEAVNAAGDVEDAARATARAALAACRRSDGAPPSDREALRARLERAATAAESAADDAAALAAEIRLRHSEIMELERSPHGPEIVARAGSEAMESRGYAEGTAASLEEVAAEARRAAAEARTRASAVPR